MKTRSGRASTTPTTWQALMSDRYPIPKSKAHVCKPRFRAACVDGYRVISRRVGNGKYLTFCPLEVAHLLDESEDVGTFVCTSEVPVKPTMPVPAMDACAVCLDDVLGPTSAFVTRCGHVFHRACVTTAWKHGYQSCAMCRAPVGRDLVRPLPPEPGTIRPRAPTAQPAACVRSGPPTRRLRRERLDQAQDRRVGRVAVGLLRRGGWGRWGRWGRR